MADEIKIQREMKQSVKNQGGHAEKLTNRFTIGIPDLGVWLSPFAPCVLEVKDLSVVVDNFDRKLDVSPKQADVLRRIQTGYGPEALVAGVVAHIVHRGRHRLVGLRHDATRLAYDYPAFIERQTGGRWDIATLLEQMRIARVHYYAT